MTAHATDVTDYVASLAEPEQGVVGTLFDRARRIVPEAEECRSYGMAALRYRGKPLIAIRAGRRGLAVYPFSSDVVAQVIATRPVADATKGGIRCTATDPIPDEVFDALVAGRLAEIDGPA
jgi:uncharacterized protein YdhG (YjbR/CyaY superfamily)